LAWREKEGPESGFTDAGDFYRERESSYLEGSGVEAVPLVFGVVFEVDFPVS